jgi:hypothetical protein
MIIYLDSVEFGGKTDPKGRTNILHGAYHAIAGGETVFYDNYVHLVVVLDHTNHYITTYINGIENASTMALRPDISQADIDIGTFFGNGTTLVPFYLNKYLTFGDGNALIDDFRFFNSAITVEEVTHYYHETL